MITFLPTLTIAISSHAGPATYPHSCQIDRHLTEQLQYLLSQALSGATQSTYTASVRRYLHFCRQSSTQSHNGALPGCSCKHAQSSRLTKPDTQQSGTAPGSQSRQTQSTQGDVPYSHSPHQSCARRLLSEFTATSTNIRSTADMSYMYINFYLKHSKTNQHTEVVTIYLQ